MMCQCVVKNMGMVRPTSPVAAPTPTSPATPTPTPTDLGTTVMGMTIGEGENAQNLVVEPPSNGYLRLIGE